MRCPITSRDIKRSRDIYATYLFHARVDTTRVDGTAVYSGRHVQLAEEDVQDDPGMVEIAAEASSAMAPLLRKVVLDVAGADYQRADLVYWVQSDDQTIIPQPHVFHVLRVLRPPWGIPGTEVSLARLDILTQTATLLERIRPDMPDVQRTAAWDARRAQLVATSDGTFGVGLVRSVPTGIAQGYLPGIPITIGLNEYAEQTQVQDIGIVDYEHPVILYEDPILLNKGDVVVLADGRRLVCADLRHRFQRMGVVLATLQMSEARRPGDLVYQIPLAIPT
jgi:hypothetical protein